MQNVRVYIELFPTFECHASEWMDTCKRQNTIKLLEGELMNAESYTD